MEKYCQLMPKFQQLRIRPDEDKEIQIISHNVQSLRRHISSISNEKTSDKVYTNSDFIMLQETWLKNEDLIQIDNFNEITRNFSATSTAQGTIIFSNHSSKIISSPGPSIIKRSGTGHIEASSIDIEGNLLVINIYKNPACNNETFIEAMNCYANIITRYDNVLVLGDFNTDLRINNAFKNLMASYQLLLLSSPRMATTKDDTCIDGVFGKLKDFDINCKPYYSYFSHHYPLVIKLLRK